MSVPWSANPGDFGLLALNPDMARQNANDFAFDGGGKRRCPCDDFGKTQDVQSVDDAIDSFGNAAREEANGFFTLGRVGNGGLDELGDGLRSRGRCGGCLVSGCDRQNVVVYHVGYD